MSKDREIKNVPASVRERLYALAKAREEDFSLIVSRYVIERLLFRLSQSSFADEFILKGAQLFHYGPMSRIDRHGIWTFSGKVNSPSQNWLLSFGKSAL
jgi:hypothetical protein